MMACSYLSAGGMKSEPTSAACWSPPAMAGCLTAETRPIAPITLPSGPMGLQSGLARLPSGPIGLPKASMAIPHLSISLPSRQIGLTSEPMGLPSRPMELPSGTMGLPGGPVGLLSGQSGQPTGQMVLPPPFARPLPMDLRSVLVKSGTSATEPALDLSTSASSMTSSLKARLPSPHEGTE